MHIQRPSWHEKDEAGNDYRLGVARPTKPPLCRIRLQLDDELEEELSDIEDEPCVALSQAAISLVPPEDEGTNATHLKAAQEDSPTTFNIHIPLARGVLSPQQMVKTNEGRSIADSPTHIAAMAPDKFELAHGGPNRMMVEPDEQRQLESPVTDSTPPETTFHRATLQFADEEQQAVGDQHTGPQFSSPPSADAVALAEEGCRILAQHRQKEAMMAEHAAMMLPVSDTISYLFVEVHDNPWMPQLSQLLDNLLLQPTTLTVEEDLRVSNDIFTPLACCEVGQPKT